MIVNLSAREAAYLLIGLGIAIRKCDDLLEDAAMRAFFGSVKPPRVDEFRAEFAALVEKFTYPQEKSR